MEKYEFRTKQPLWVWIPIAFILIFAIIYVGMTKKYELGIIWLIYAIITYSPGPVILLTLLRQTILYITPDWEKQGNSHWLISQK